MLHAGVVRTLVVSLVIVCASALQGCGDDQSGRVQQSWDKWVAASIAKDGPNAVALMNSDTISYYESVRTHALESDASTVKTLPLLQRMLVLTTRINVDPAYLQTLNGSQLLMVGMADGWMNSAGDPTKLTLGNIRVDGEVARGDLSMAGNPAQLPIRFTKEDGVWKVDLSPLISETESLISQQMARGGGATPEQMNEMLPMVLAQQTGKKVGPEIWDKPKLK